MFLAWNLKAGGMMKEEGGDNITPPPEGGGCSIYRNPEPAEPQDDQ